MPNITLFDTSAPYIFLPIFITTFDNRRHEFDAILDTGAPATEFSDKALQYAGFIPRTSAVEIKSGLQTQKYSKTTIPLIEICGHKVENSKVFVSRFDDSWGIDALIGLDFFRLFRTEIDFLRGQIISEPYI